MPFEDARSHLRDILESILLIEQFVRGMDLEAYKWDPKTQAAVERKILIISEAAIRLKDEAEVLCPGVPWRDIRGIGNWLRHQYDRVEIISLDRFWHRSQQVAAALTRGCPRRRLIAWSSR
jgi:uncharacterized protein with HEPN domain